MLVYVRTRDQVALTASGTGRSDPLYSTDVGQAVGPKPALMVYTFFLEESFSPSRDRCGCAYTTRNFMP